jgi:ubiquinol-cytochrome c reductase cytochrome c subunit
MRGRLTTFLLAAFALGVIALLTTMNLGAGADSSVGAPSGSDLVEQGRELYLTSCASCHSVDGRGTKQGPKLIGVGAASADFQLTTGRMPLTDPSVQAVRKPPAFNRKEIEALVAYVASLGPGPRIPNVDPSKGDLAKGGELYRLNCAACHSSTGVGGALSYGRDAPSLGEATGVQIAEAMRTGPGQMPVFGPDTFDQKQVNGIVRYVRYLRDPEDPGGFSLGRIGPIPEGLVALVVGLGALMIISRWIEHGANAPQGGDQRGGS